MNDQNEVVEVTTIEKHQLLLDSVNSLSLINNRLRGLAQRINQTTDEDIIGKPPIYNSLHSVLSNTPSEIDGFTKDANLIIDQIESYLF